MKLFTFISLLLVCSLNMEGQIDPSSMLFQQLKTSDSLLFEVGFNTCSITPFEELVNEDFEFYHDQGGITPSKQAFIESLGNGLFKLSYKARRELDESSLTVYELRKNDVVYGAIQSGIHRFYAKEKDKPEYLSSIARFTHVWLLEDGVWKLSRVLSYDHN